MAYAANLDYNNRPASRLALNHQHIQRHPSQLQLVDDIESLDESVLTSEMISPASAGDRRDSFANSSALFSPQSTHWGDDFSAPALDRTQSLSNNPFLEQDNNPFTRLDRPHLATYNQQPSSTWPLVDRTADSRTPFAHPANDAYASDFEPAQPYMTVGSSAPAYNGLPHMPSNVRPTQIFPPNTQGTETLNPLSPADKWMPLNTELEHRPLPKRMRQNSPPRSFSPSLRIRGDGIRKKNARFEIPPERNLLTIDRMIEEADNEDEVKELKQQKRLLRNRQAALDSRQRKKKHTEDLEKEKTGWQERMAGLEEDLAAIRLQYDNERAQWAQLEQHLYQTQQQAQNLILEKEDLVIEHTRETGELRKKISILTEKLNSKASGPATVTPCSTEFTDFAADMNGLTMDQDEWNNYIFVDPMFHEQDGPQHPQQPAQPNTALVVASRPKQQQLISDADKPVASGLLIWLLLCGAFVASQSSGTFSRMPDNVRAEATTVLNDILKEDAANMQPSHHHLVASQVNALEPGPSGVPTAWQPKATLSGAEFASISNPSGLGIDGSNLDQLHQNLVMPTKDQEAEQLFSLTANQYNSMTSTEFNRPAYHMPPGASDTPPMTDEGSTSPSNARKTLAQELQRMRDKAHSGDKAAVYTRSLLEEQITPDIVRDFKRMVGWSSEEAAGEQNVKSEA